MSNILANILANFFHYLQRFLENATLESDNQLVTNVFQK